MSDIASEMFARYGQALWVNRVFALLLAGTAVALSVPRVRASARGLPRWVGPVALAGALVLGVAWGWKLAWLGDDAYISFRYADNLVRGNGLVFNPGERVEGYTNFLFTLLLAGAIRGGLDPGQVSIVWGLACFAGLIALLPRILHALRPAAGVPLLPLAALLSAGQYTLASFATSGLETMFAATLVALALERALSGAPLAAGAAGIAATLAHPDHGILYAALGLALFLEPGRRRELLRYSLPFVGVYIPYFLWRWHWYGDFFPNTYYAKSAHLSYFEQGWVYIASFAIGSGFWLGTPLVAFGVWRARRTILGRTLLIGVPLFVLYVAKIGGDFMYGRLLVPLLAPLLLAGEVGWRELLSERRTLLAGVGLAALAMVVVPTRILEPGEKKWHVSDERTFYPVASFSPLVVRSRYFRWARGLNEHFVERGVTPRLGLQCVGTVGYYTGLEIVDALGITDRELAHRPIEIRGRPGHEKVASADDLIEREVDLSDTPLFPAPYRDLTRLRLGRFDYYLARYDAELLTPLSQQGDVEFTDIDALLGGYFESPVSGSPGARKSDAEVACDGWFFGAYYFSEVPDSPYRAAFSRLLLEAGRPALRASESAAPKLPFEFEETHVARPVGISFGPSSPAGSRRRSPPFELSGDVLELWVGGGGDRRSQSVALWIDGVRRFQATGCRSNRLGRRLWYVAPFRGKRATLELIEEGRGAFGHLTVERIVQWLPESADAG